MRASDVRVIRILKAVFPGQAGLDVVLDTLEPLDVTFTSVSLNYSSSAPNNASRFSIQAIPDLGTIPGLSTVLAPLGLSAKDLTLLTAPEGLVFGLSKTIDLDLPSPFSSTSVNIGLAMNSTSKTLMLSGRFNSTVSLLGKDVRLSASADVTGSSNGALLVDLSGRMSRISFPELGDIGLGPFAVDATFERQVDKSLIMKAMDAIGPIDIPALNIKQLVAGLQTLPGKLPAITVCSKKNIVIFYI